MKKINLFYITGMSLLIIVVVFLILIRIIEGYDAAITGFKIYGIALLVIGCSFLFIGIFDKRKNRKR